MVKPEQVADGIMAFAEAELLPAMDGWRMWASSAALVLARQRADLLLAALLGNKTAAMLGIVDEKGMIDIDAATNALKETARTQGKLTVDIPMMGKFSFGENDFDSLREHILQAGK